MKNCRWRSPARFLIGVLVGVGVALFVVPSLRIEAFAQAEAPRRVQFIKTADILYPSGRGAGERWEDPETKSACYVLGQLGASCVK